MREFVLFLAANLTIGITGHLRFSALSKKILFRFHGRFCRKILN
jgi:hypothetical protein